MHTPEQRFASIADCPDCTTKTATADSGYTAAALKLCAAHRAAEDAEMDAALAAQPELEAIHRLVGWR